MRPSLPSSEARKLAIKLLSLQVSREAHDSRKLRLLLKRLHHEPHHRQLIP